MPNDSRAPAAGTVDDVIHVDLTLVDEMLARTPQERIQANDRMVRAIEELRHGFQSARARDAARPPGGERD
jgi:hypothetical protein